MKISELKNFIKRNEKIILGTLFVLLLLYGFAVRIYGLGQESLWLDESISANAAKKINEKGAPVLDSGMLYSRAMLFHYAMSGFLLFSDTDFNARLISAIFGIATCILIFYIAKEYSKQAAWIAFIFSLFLEIFIVSSRQARMYQMEMFFFFLTLYLLYKSMENKKLFWWSLVPFAAALDTHLIAALLLPYYVYVGIQNKISKWLYPIGGLAVLLVIYKYGALLAQLNFHYLLAYLEHLKYYAPFVILSLLGFFFVWKCKLSWFLAASALLILAAASVNKLFALRYVYLAFLPIVILASVSLSKIRFNILIAALYIIWVSNIFYPVTYSSIILPEAQISHYDPTEPRAEFKQAYNQLENFSRYENETLIVSLTAMSEWYFKKPDYWIYLSFTRLPAEPNETYGVYAGKDAYTGAEIIYDVDELKEIESPKIVVLDSWSASRINKNITTFINNQCESMISRKGVTVYRCN